MTEEDQPVRHNLLYQIAVTVVLGIPMTLALGIALAFYCAYEYIKFHFAGTRHSQMPDVARRR